MIDDYGFKFKLGDSITTKLKSDTTGMIMERILQQCDGGIQRHYKIRTYIIYPQIISREPAITPAKELTIFNEVELKKAE